MKISAKAKERFCKDCNIPVKIFEEPVFMDRLSLLDPFYRTLEKWKIFEEELQKYPCEQDYFEEYNRVKDAAILSIKNSESYKRFNEEDMNRYKVSHENLPGKDIFKETNDGRTFISIDMKKANFSSLHHYDPQMFRDCFKAVDTWEEFIGKFTDNKHIINSKYIRQVILGNCNPKRHITYEKYLMDGILTGLLAVTSLESIVFFSNDEIVIDTSDLGNKEKIFLLTQVREITDKAPVPLRIQMFVLHKIYGTEGFYKKFLREDGREDIEFKCLDAYMLPFVIRAFLGEEPKENDKVFYYEGLPAMFLQVPDIRF